MKNITKYLPEHLDITDVREVTALQLGTGTRYMSSFKLVSVGEHDDEGMLRGTAETISRGKLTWTGDEDSDSDYAEWVAHLVATLAGLGWSMVYPDDLEPGCMIELARLG